MREELPRLLAERGWSGRELARRLGLRQSYVSAVVTGKRSPSRRFVEQAAAALDLPGEYFREYREAVVLEGMRADPRLLDRLYRLVQRGR